MDVERTDRALRGDDGGVVLDPATGAVSQAATRALRAARRAEAAGRGGDVGVTRPPGRGWYHGR